MTLSVGHVFLDVTTKEQAIKEKNKLDQIKKQQQQKLLCYKQFPLKCKKATHRIGESIFKSYMG